MTTSDTSTEATSGVPTGLNTIQCEGKGGDYVWLAGNPDNTVNLANSTDDPQSWSISATGTPGSYYIQQESNAGLYLAADDSHDPNVYLTDDSESAAIVWKFDLVSGPNGNIYNLVSNGGPCLNGHTGDKRVSLTDDAKSSGAWWSVSLT